MIKDYEPPKTNYLKTRHKFKGRNIYLKPDVSVNQSSPYQM